VSLDDELEATNEEEGQYRREARLLRTENEYLRRERETLRERLDIATAVDAASLVPPKWVRTHSGVGHHGIVSVVLADTHYGEVVDPKQIEFINAYDPRIAEIRTRAFFEKTLVLARDYVKGITYDGGVMFMTGDIFSGTIHDELTQTNAETTAESIVHWIEPLVAGINLLAADLGHLLVPCVVGNHGRNTRKPRAKLRAQDNNDWLLYKLLQREFKGRKDVQIMVSDGADLMVPIYGTKFLEHHGDQYRGGSGISAMLSPLMLGHARKGQRAMAVGRPFDWEVMGHWHNYWQGKGIIVSGALKGTDEYSYLGNFSVEPPRLAWWVTTPERGVTISAPVEPADRKNEGW
jgi:hypothetical protein